MITKSTELWAVYFGIPAKKIKKRHRGLLEDVIGLIDRCGVGIVVIESRYVVDLPEFQLLAKAMDDHRFRMIDEIPVLTNVSEFENLSIRVYRYLNKLGNPPAMPGDSLRFDRVKRSA